MNHFSIRPIALFGAFGTLLLTQQAFGQPRGIEAANRFARGTVSAVGNGLGVAACARGGVAVAGACGYAAGQLGGQIYDRSQQFTRWSGERFEAAGRQLRQRANGRR